VRILLEVGVLADDEVLLPLQGVYTFMQGDFGGIARKPTTLGTNLELTLPDMVDDLEKMDLTLTPGSL
jgi:hypothetical protein